MLTERSFAKGETLQVEGQLAHSLGMVKLGTLMGNRHGPDGEPRPVAMLGRGNVLGKYGLYGQTNPLTITSLSSGRLCVLRMSDLKQGGGLSDELLRGVLEIMTRTFGRLADWSQVMRMRGLSRQVLAALMVLGQEQGSRSVYLPGQAALAQLLSTTRESVARTLAQLAQSGRIKRIDARHVQLVDPVMPGPGADPNGG